MPGLNTLREFRREKSITKDLPRRHGIARDEAGTEHVPPISFNSGATDQVRFGEGAATENRGRFDPNTIMPWPDNFPEVILVLPKNAAALLPAIPLSKAELFRLRNVAAHLKVIPLSKVEVFLPRNAKGRSRCRR